MAFVAANGMTEEGTSRTVQAMGTTIHYHEMGEGYPVFLLHSFGPGVTAWITWHKVIAEFAKHYRCIAMDLPNYAKTGPVIQDENIHSFQAKTALALMEELGIEKAHIVGNSQGGQSSMSFANNVRLHVCAPEGLLLRCLKRRECVCPWHQLPRRHGCKPPARFSGGGVFARR